MNRRDMSEMRQEHLRKIQQLPTGHSALQDHRAITNTDFLDNDYLVWGMITTTGNGFLGEQGRGSRDRDRRGKNKILRKRMRDNY